MLPENVVRLVNVESSVKAIIIDTHKEVSDITTAATAIRVVFALQRNIPAGAINDIASVDNAVPAVVSVLDLNLHVVSLPACRMRGPRGDG